MTPRITTPASALLLALIAGCGGSDGAPAVLDAKASATACTDMVTKSGDWQTAQKLYANARLSPDYAQWNRETMVR